MANCPNGQRCTSPDRCTLTHCEWIEHYKQIGEQPIKVRQEMFQESYRTVRLARLSGRTESECKDALFYCDQDMGKALAFLCRPLEDREVLVLQKRSQL